MKRIFIIFLFAAALVFSGFQGKPSQTHCVTHIEVLGEQNGVAIQRSYTKEEKMRAVLMYLRLLEPGDVPEVDPDRISADVNHITLVFSNGEQRTYTQKGHRYFRKDSGPWQNIPPQQAAALYALMRRLESD